MIRSVPCSWTGRRDLSHPSPHTCCTEQGRCWLFHAQATPKCQGHLPPLQQPHSGKRSLHAAATPLLATKGPGCPPLLCCLWAFSLAHSWGPGMLSTSETSAYPPLKGAARPGSWMPHVYLFPEDKALRMRWSLSSHNLFSSFF